MNSLKIILKIILIGFFIFVITRFYQIGIVFGHSMEPTLKPYHLLVIQKFHFNIEANDIVIIKKKNQYMIKRVIGLPNDEVQIKEYPYINGNQFDNVWIENPGEITEVLLKENEYFVLGDNRQNSIDSRFSQIGIIERKEIIGKVLGRK